jgi:hypothetical protein
MSQKRQAKNLKRKKLKPVLSKFERRQVKIRNKIINDGLEPIRTNLLNSLGKNTQAYLQSSDNHHNTASRPTAL